MELRARSENLRRSKRLQEKNALDVMSESKIDSRAVENPTYSINSRKSQKTSKSSQASRVRRAEIETAIKKKQLEQEELKKEKEMLDLELALKLAEIEEGSESSGSEWMHESRQPNMENWIDGNSPWDFRQDTKACEVRQLNSVKEHETVRDIVVNNKPEKSSIFNNDNNSGEMTIPQITKILTRQSLPKDLPTFDGNPLEWPNFIYQYNNSSAICGYSDAENQFRLQKCLKGNARKIVQSLLIMPQNVQKIIDLLHARFGRSEYIISMLLEKIKRFPSIREDKLDIFIEFSDEIKNFVATIESLQETDHLQNPILLNEVLNKLPTCYKLSWAEHLSKMPKPNLKLVEFTNWLDEKANLMSQIQIPKIDDIRIDNQKVKYKNRDVTMTTTLSTRKNCFCCNREIHHLSSCSRFLEMTPDERWTFMTKTKMCFSCLMPFHNVKQCRKRKICGIQDCRRPHHTLLHKTEHSNNVTSTNDIEQSPAVVETNCRISGYSSVLLKILPVIISYCNETVETYVLLDDASTISLIDQEFADSLGLSGPSESLCLQWTNEDVVHHQNDSRIVSFTIKGINNGPSFQLRHVRTTQLSLPSQTIDVDKIRSRYPYICDKIASMKDVQPKIIIGQDNWPLLVNRKLITGPWNGPAMSKTLLGWVLHGNIEESEYTPQFVCNIRHINMKIKDDLDLLHDLVKEQWKMESIHSTTDKVMSIEDKRAQDILDTTMKRVGERFETGLLWKNNHPVLPESKSNALKRLQCTERKMDRNKDYSDMYCKKFLDLEQKGYIRKLAAEEIRVRKEDCCAQRLLWRGMERNVEPDIYELSVVFFGATCSPCLAQEAKNRNARDFAEEFPEASDEIIKNHYMDDYLGNADTEEEAKKLIKEVIFLHSQGGFVICNWIANKTGILEDIDEHLLAECCKNIENNNDEMSTERILGVFWNHQRDIFVFKTKFHKIEKDLLENRRRPTKREILKIVMSIFDPLGFLTYFIIQGKVLLQDIWRSQIGWDDEISDNLEEKWKLWLFDLKNIYKIEIPRQYFTMNRQESDIQLHVFCDASETCYATVVYLRVEHKQEVKTCFVTAKARVAPLKPLSIPRLELQAALLGARLGNSLKTSLNLTFSKIFYWSDSRTVLQWINSEARRFQVFVAQRLGEIQDITNVSEWKYVYSKENPADEATKRPSSWDKNKWFNGPGFLSSGPEKWPKENKDLPEIDSDTLEMRQTEFVFLNSSKKIMILPDAERFSKWQRLLRSTAYVLRFIKIMKSKVKNQKELSVDELHEAENLIYRKIQEDSFPQEVHILRNKGSLNPKSRIYMLTCIYSEEDGLIKLSGRLDKSSLDMEMKRPIILDPTHKITKLIIINYHEAVHHYGQEIVINNLRKKFWILRMRQAVKSVWRNCLHCKIKRSVPIIPMMGQLPQCRIEPTIRPFIKTGIDYFGPLEVTVKRSREKRYGVIFTCMATRAVHLEIAHDMSTNSFINVLRQFGCRRGFPEEIYCDNGSNLRGSEKELAENLKELNQDDIMKFCAMKNIKYFYNAPLAPHMGGSWERLIQSVKKILKEILKSRYPPEHILRTFLTECENILNTRPLTHVSLDSEDSESLTPNHFLIGPNYAALPCTKTIEKDLNLMSSWRAAQKLSDTFWKRWSKEYVPTLIRRTKWFQERRNIEVGDVVIMAEPNSPRNVWPKGIVVNLYPAADGKIRIVDVKNGHGTLFRRHVSRLIVLDVKK